MLSSPSARAAPAEAMANAIAVAVTFQFMFCLPFWLLLALPADEEEDCHDGEREKQESGGDRVDFRCDDAAKLAEHVGGECLLPARLDKFGDHDVVKRDDEGEHEAGQDAGPNQRQR